ncbi:hypothetical protein GO685_01290, partial [Wolbachia endosymbiont of Madathamugadia hiepei]|nr:hypothetical protein [Wolbachia endosymbiont of Madathamugadia hiepei]
ISLFVAKLNYQFLLHLSLFSHDKLFSQRLVHIFSTLISYSMQPKKLSISSSFFIG